MYTQYIEYTVVYEYMILYIVIYIYLSFLGWHGTKMIKSFEVKSRKIWVFTQVLETAVLQFPQIPRTPWDIASNLCPLHERISKSM